MRFSALDSFRLLQECADQADQRIDQTVRPKSIAVNDLGLAAGFLDMRSAPELQEM